MGIERTVEGQLNQAIGGKWTRNYQWIFKSTSSATQRTYDVQGITLNG